jgi:1,4-dihydroxy-6-naphthoate synthase
MMVPITLAHSPDPDDAFMWWPLTGKIQPPREPWQAGDPIRHARAISSPAINTGRFEFRALPADIEQLNRRAAATADLDITALSVRAWADVQDRYAITSCGASFGDGFGPKLVARATDSRLNCHNCCRAPEVRIAIPGKRTTAFLMLGLALGVKPDSPTDRFVEMPFDQIIGAVARSEVDAGLVIHEGQLTFADAGLKLLLDVGQWWKQKTSLKLPLGINAISRSLDRHGPNTITEISGLLKQSVAMATSRWDESVAYTLPFAAENARRAGSPPPDLARVDAYCRMYVTEETRDMGQQGRQAIHRLLSEGASASLSPPVAAIETV